MSRSSSPDLRLRRLRTVTEAVSDAFSLYFRDFLFLALIVAPLFPVHLATGLAGEALVEQPIADRPEDIELAPLFRDLILYVGLTVPLSFIGGAVVAAAVVSHLLLTDAGLGEPGAGKAWRDTLSRLMSVVGASLRSGIIVGLLTVSIVGIPWAINRYVRWAFITQAVIADGQSAASALEHSAFLVRDRWWRTFWRLLFITVVAGVLGVASSAASGLPSPASSIFSAASTLTTPFSVIATTLIFFDLRERRRADVLF